MARFLQYIDTLAIAEARRHELAAVSAPQRSRAVRRYCSLSVLRPDRSRPV
jgi:hypothetical protein